MAETVGGASAASEEVVSVPSVGVASAASEEVASVPSVGRPDGIHPEGWFSPDDPMNIPGSSEKLSGAASPPKRCGRGLHRSDLVCPK